MTDEERKRLENYKHQGTLNQSEIADYFVLLVKEQEEASKPVEKIEKPEVAEVVVEKPKKKKAKK